MTNNATYNGNVYPRETVEFQGVHITIDGTPVTTGVQLCIVPRGTRPSGWVSPVTINGVIGIMVTGLLPGFYGVWAKVTSSPETPVIDCGYFQIN